LSHHIGEKPLYGDSVIETVSSRERPTSIGVDRHTKRAMRELEARAGGTIMSAAGRHNRWDHSTVGSSEANRVRACPLGREAALVHQPMVI